MTPERFALLISLLVLAGCAAPARIAGSSAMENCLPDVTAAKLSGKDSTLARKYAAILAVGPENINAKLYGFIDDWMSTPYRWGGMDKTGIDCSAFILRLLREVYGLHLPRTSLEQCMTARVERFTALEYLAEGDILFFRTVGTQPVSHVGMYLQNNRFINSSSHKGVVIYDFNRYWRKRFVIAARVRVSVAKHPLIQAGEKRSK